MPWRPEIDFFLEHRDQIAAIVEIDRFARSTIVETTSKRLYDAIKQAAIAWSGLRDLDVDRDGATRVWWYSPRFYDNVQEVGAFFCLGDLDEATLINDVPEPGKEISLHLSFWQKSPNPDRAEAILNALRSSLSGRKLELQWSEKDKEFCLVKEAIGDILNVRALSDLDTAVTKVTERARSFTVGLIASLPSLFG